MKIEQFVHDSFQSLESNSEIYILVLRLFNDADSIQLT
jgi:hypothetical protein